MSLEIELGNDGPTTRCECCGATSRTVHGFIYDRGDARAVYYAGWSEGHPDDGVTMAIAVGDWDEGADATRRVSIGLRARASEQEVHFSVLRPEESPWSRTELLGAMLPRTAALGHPVLKEVFTIAEYIVRNDDRVARFLA